MRNRARPTMLLSMSHLPDSPSQARLVHVSCTFAAYDQRSFSRSKANERISRVQAAWHRADSSTQLSLEGGGNPRSHEVGMLLNARHERLHALGRVRVTGDHVADRLADLAGLLRGADQLPRGGTKRGPHG